MIKLNKIILIALSILLINNILCTPISYAADFNDLIPGKTNQGSTKIGYVSSLPQGDWTAIVATVIKMMLQIAGALAVASFTFGGVTMIISQGNDEKLRKGKGIIYWSLLALIIIAISYAIILGVTQLKFFG
jgi:hypothetical protein